MPLRGPVKQHRDPIYSSKGHKANIRYWRLAQQPCVGEASDEVGVADAG